jgi:putative hemolysin
VQITNSASENCIQQGGTLSIQTRGDGGQYGICLFEDNRQCEEWPLLRGDCPVGGVKITGYVTPAAVYCAITGGEYAVTGNSNTEDEQGTCTFKKKKGLTRRITSVSSVILQFAGRGVIEITPLSNYAS